MTAHQITMQGFRTAALAVAIAAVPIIYDLYTSSKAQAAETAVLKHEVADLKALLPVMARDLQSIKIDVRVIVKTERQREMRRLRAVPPRP